MQHFLDLFTPETWRSFCATDMTVTGFRPRQRRVASETVEVGDIFLCYLTRLSRWCGVLQVGSNAYEDTSPIHSDPDPFTIRFKVEPIVTLSIESSIPIRTEAVWDGLNLTNQYEKDYPYWSGPFRRSLKLLSSEDGEFLVRLLQDQRDAPKSYPLSAHDRRKLASPRRVPSLDGEIEVEIPEGDADEDDATDKQPDSEQSSKDNVRESIQVQASVAEIGAKMNFQVWIPRSDRARVLEQVPATLHEAFLEKLPLNYEENTLRTIEQIDVLWLKGRSMVRAFEIEHTTAVYSGLLRMADLLALQPNMDIRLNIVAPIEKRDKVLGEIMRPVFSLLDRRPLRDQCSFLSYESIKSMSEIEHLAHMNDTIVEEYEEFADV